MLRRSLIRRVEIVEARLAGIKHVCALDLSSLSSDLLERMQAAMQVGTFPQSLTDSDLEAIVAAADVTRGKK